MSRVCQRCNHGNSDEAKFCLQCGAMLEVEVENAGDPLVGKILLGRYRIARILGEGGMGKVYLAEQKMGTAVRKVAIKTLHPELSGDPQIVARFHRECETVIELHHPNTVQFYDFGELEDKTLFIVMELIEGEDLAHTLQRGVLDPARADRIMIQVCGSLNEAHQRGIVHRDLKPENILLTQRGGQQDFVKVLDFGIAKRSEAEDASSAKLTKQGMVLGTPPYMSPEQFSGQALDFRSDIYSLGVMTYEMLTGHLPFEARTPWEWATKHLTQPPTPIESYPQGAALPERKKNAIMRALSKAREQRQGSVLEFMQEFTGIQDTQAAWTMATSAGLKASTGSPSQPQIDPRVPIGTPQPMPQAGYPTPVPYGPGSSPGMPMGGHPGYSTPVSNPQMPAMGMPNTHPGMSGMGSYDGMSTPPPANESGGFGKVLAVLAFLLVVVGGGVAGAGWWWTHHRATDPVATNDPPSPTEAGVGSVGHGDTGVGGTVGTPIATSDPTPDTTRQDPPPSTATPDAGATETAMTETPTTEETAMAEETAMTETPSTMEERPSANQPSPADVERARNFVRDAETALGRSDVEGAIRAVAQAQRAVGRGHASLAGVRGDLTRRGSNMVGILMQQGKCPSAQQLYRELRAVGAESASRQHFSPDWCPRP